ncbi:DoxX family protein [Nocardia paucivorans]|uniref:DoxX family protein n=1 Tax=Nocardia paucivorans TaxID=114259 RepID=UPI0002E6DE56|nr:DoxX family protein [Nocardia paucivorans]
MSAVLPVTAAVVTAVCIAANVFIVAADLLRVDFVLANSAEVGLPSTAIPYLALLKGAGAVGLLAGFAGMDPIGVAAAVGLLLFYTGAVMAHIRARVFHNIGFPVLFLFLAAGAVTYFLVVAR